MGSGSLKEDFSYLEIKKKPTKPDAVLIVFPPPVTPRVSLSHYSTVCIRERLGYLAPIRGMP